MESTAFKISEKNPAHVIRGPLVAPGVFRADGLVCPVPAVLRQREAAVSGSWTERAADRRQRWTAGVPPGALALIV